MNRRRSTALRDVTAIPTGVRGGPVGIRSLAAASVLVLLFQSSAFADGDNASGWAVMAESSLQSSLRGWADSAGWTVFWDGPFDYRLRVSASFSGSFEEAVASLVHAVRLSEPGIAVTLYRGNKVVHVRTDGHGD